MPISSKNRPSIIGEAATAVASPRSPDAEALEVERPATHEKERAERRARLLAVAESAEAELLLWCLRSGAGGEKEARIRELIAGDVDWPLVLRMARRNAVGALLYRALSDACPAAVPEAVLVSLKECYRANAARNLFLTAELVKVLRLLEAEGIPAVPFKGPVLAAVAYGDIALRRTTDLDILIKKQDIDRAGRLLISNGYRRVGEVVDHDEETAFQKHCKFRHTNGGPWVELHWRVTSAYFPFPIDYSGLWDRLEKVRVAGSEMLALSPEDRLMFLCAHGSEHAWDQLQCICDIAQVISTGAGIDWQRVRRRCQRGGQRRLFVTLLLARELLAAPVPASIVAEAQSDVRVLSLEAEVRRRLLAIGSAGAGHVATCGFQMRALERMRDKVLFCLGLLRHGVSPNASTRSRIQLPRALRWLYYVMHPFRLAATYGVGSVKYLLKHGV